MSQDLDVAVVGAGIAGLTAAHELARAGLAVRVFEAADHVGGRMTSARHAGYTIDTGAEQVSPRGYRATWELLARLGMRDDEVPPIGRPVAVWRGGRAHTGVADPRGLVGGAGLSWRARLDLLRLQAWAARRPAAFDVDHPERLPMADRTIAEFSRRYHPDLHDYLLQPVGGSFFGWDTARSSAGAFVDLMMSVGGSLRWRTYRDGMDTVARRLAAELDVVTGWPADEVIADRAGARLRAGAETVSARSVLLCVPAPIAARLHANPPVEEREFLAMSTFTPTLKVSCLLRAPLSAPGKSRPHLLVIPRAEDPVLSAISFDHERNPKRAPSGRGLLTLLTDPALVPELLAAPDHQVAERLTSAVPRYLPEFDAVHETSFVHRHPHGLPEATPAALHGRARFLARPVRSVDYAGDWVMARPASEGAVRAGALAASRVLSRLEPTTHAAGARRDATVSDGLGSW